MGGVVGQVLDPSRGLGMTQRGSWGRVEKDDGMAQSGIAVGVYAGAWTD